MKKNIFFIAILGFISLSLKSENNKPFTEEDYEKASFLKKIFTTQGQQKTDQKVLKEGIAFDNNGNTYHKEQHEIRMQTINKNGNKEHREEYYINVPSFGFNNKYRLSEKDIKAIQEKKDLLEEKQTLIAPFAKPYTFLPKLLLPLHKSL